MISYDWFEFGFQKLKPNQNFSYHRPLVLGILSDQLCVVTHYTNKQYTVYGLERNLVWEQYSLLYCHVLCWLSCVDKRLDESENIDLSNGTSNGLIDLFERDNKSLQQRNRDLEKQLHMLRASSSRVPPCE